MPKKPAKPKAVPPAPVVLKPPRRAKNKLPSGKSVPVAGCAPLPPEDAAAQGMVLPVVGVGASAGGLEAFTQLLQHLPIDSGMAFVLVQHLHPEYESALTEILSRVTSMPVAEVVDGMVIEPNHVYVIPPNTYLAVLHGVLHLVPRTSIAGQNLPIDYFLRSLADDQGSKAIGVILSGTASDGVLGLKAIKGEGGITFAQDEKTAKYNGMPHSAIAAGCVDFILSPEKIAAELARISRHPFVLRGAVEGLKQTPDWVDALPTGADDLNKIFLVLRRFSGNDFTYYKRTTTQRRIKRRMLLHKLERLKDYVRYLHDHPNEVRELFHDLLINVTSFFRDPEAFVALKEVVFPAVLNRPAETPVRLWVPGCASGEEAYSIAIALLEHLGDRGGITPVQIFATDIDEDAIEKARAGVYPENIAQDVSPERLRRFFLKVEGGYQISKHIRDMCVFATQNVIKDPPFSKVDLISCRNLLIYLGQVLQKKVLTIFHYALNPGGFLQLGSAESIGEFADLFRAVDPKVKLYAKKSIATPQRMDFGSVAAASPPLGASVSSPPPAARSGLDMQREADRLILNKYAPAAVVINEALDILQFRGQTGAYLEPAPGEASLNLLKMAREGLRSALNTAVRNAKRRHTTTRSAGVNIRYDGRMRTLDIEVMPIPGTATSERCYLVVFQEAQVAVTKGQTSKGKRSPQKQDHKVTELEQELISTKEYLQSVIEQQETSNEELRSANEEIQSSNEELQSINEELETTKEELQSTNEELATVNDELGSRNFELSQLNNDLNNLIGSVNLAIVIVGLDLCIRRYTPQMEKLLNLIASDIGRPITDIRLNFEMPHLAKQISETIDAVRSQQIEIQDHSGRWYSLRIMPYKTLDNQITGAILVFVDVDELKKGMEQARTARDYAESIISAMRHPLLVLDKHLRVVSASTAYLDTFQVNAHATLGNLLYRLGNGQWGVPTLRAALEATISQGTAFEDFSITHDFENIGPRTVLISGRPIAVGPTNAPLVLMQIEMVASHAIDGV